MNERANPLLKRVDAWLGRPLVWVLGVGALLRRLGGTDRHRFDALRDRVGAGKPIVFTLLKSAAIGDTVMLSAVIVDLRRLYPTSRLRLACGRSNREAAALIEGLDEIVVLPMTSPAAILRALPSLSADVFFDFDSWPRINAVIAAASGSPITIGFRTPGQQRHAAYTATVDHDAARHELDNYRALAAVLATRIGPAGARFDAEPRLRIPDGPAAGRDAVIHMFAGGSQAAVKEWPSAHWRMVIDALLAEGVRVKLSGGPGDVARNEAFRASLQSPGAVEVMPAGPLAALAAALAAARLVIAVDTGVAHLAAAVGAPTIVLHGPTAPSRWGARGAQAHHLHDGQAAWISLGFERSATGKQMRVDPAQVIALAVTLISDAAPNRTPGASRLHEPIAFATK